MTGKEFILFILENNLENEELVKDGELLGFMSLPQAAIKFNVGMFTMLEWCRSGRIKGYRLGDQIFIPVNCEDPRNMHRKEVVGNAR